jgi:hypothetical protein
MPCRPSRVPRLLVKVDDGGFRRAIFCHNDASLAEAVVTIAPVAPSAISRFATHWDANNGTRTLTDIVSSNWSGGTSSQSFPG